MYTVPDLVDHRFELSIDAFQQLGARKKSPHQGRICGDIRVFGFHRRHGARWVGLGWLAARWRRLSKVKMLLYLTHRYDTGTVAKPRVNLHHRNSFPCVSVAMGKVSRRRGGKKKGRRAGGAAGDGADAKAAPKLPAVMQGVRSCWFAAKRHNAVTSVCCVQLNSPTAPERQQACMSVAGVLAGEGVPDSVVSELLGAGVIDRLLPRACDQSPQVAQHALAALRYGCHGRYTYVLTCSVGVAAHSWTLCVGCFLQQFGKCRRRDDL